MTAPSRKSPPLRVKLASALLALRGRDGERLIPHEDAKLMTADQIISLFQFNHYPIRHEAGGPAEPWNLDPELIAAHRKITAERDVPQAAKIKRVRRAVDQHQAVMAAKVTGDAPPEDRRRGPKIKSRGFQQGHRPLRSRNNLRRVKP